jgi:hypothetical protein
MSAPFVQMFSNFTETENGALTYKSSLNKVLDFFSNASTVKSADEALSLFNEAYSDNTLLAVKALCFLRDVRGGQGRRHYFRHIFEHMANSGEGINWAVTRMIPHIPEIGRFDDLFWNITKWDNYSDEVKDLIKKTIEDGLNNPQTSALVAKWMPRKGYEAKLLREMLGLTPKLYRKMLVSKTNVVETKMCAKDWNNIVFEHVPSVAGLRYSKAFTRNAPDKYGQYKNDLKEGKTTINSKVLYPYQIVDKIDELDVDILEAMWNSLPNYMGDGEHKILPVIDVSGSMDQKSGANSTAMNIAVSLGLYMAEKQQGTFSNFFVTFSSNPQFVKLQGNTFVEKVKNIKRADWGYGTNLQAVFSTILTQAKLVHLPQSEMPSIVVILSDMEFNPTENTTLTNYQQIKENYLNHGYKLPTVVFWNLASRTENKAPVLYNEYSTVMVGGFSPVLMKHILSGNLEGITPEQLMLQVLNEKYKFLED